MDLLIDVVDVSEGLDSPSVFLSSTISSSSLLLLFWSILKFSTDAPNVDDETRGEYNPAFELTLVGVDDMAG